MSERMIQVMRTFIQMMRMWDFVWLGKSARVNEQNKGRRCEVREEKIYYCIRTRLLPDPEATETTLVDLRFSPAETPSFSLSAVSWNFSRTGIHTRGGRDVGGKRKAKVFAGVGILWVMEGQMLFHVVSPNGITPTGFTSARWWQAQCAYDRYVAARMFLRAFICIRELDLSLIGTRCQEFCSFRGNLQLDSAFCIREL